MRMNRGQIVVVEGGDWQVVGERLRRLNPRMYERLLSMARRSLAIEEDPLGVIAADLAAIGPTSRDDYSTDA